MTINHNIAISDTGFIFNPTTGESFTVNVTGLEIILAIKEGKSFQDISKNILHKYSTDAATVEKDYFDFVLFLKQYKFVTDDEQTDV